MLHIYPASFRIKFFLIKFIHLTSNTDMMYPVWSTPFLQFSERSTSLFVGFQMKVWCVFIVHKKKLGPKSVHLNACFSSFGIQFANNYPVLVAIEIFIENLFTSVLKWNCFRIIFFAIFSCFRFVYFMFTSDHSTNTLSLQKHKHFTSWKMFPFHFHCWSSPPLSFCPILIMCSLVICLINFFSLFRLV